MAAEYVAGSVGDATTVGTSINVTPGVLTTGGSAQPTTTGNALLVFVGAFEEANNPVDITGASATGATFVENETRAMDGFPEWQNSNFTAEGITGQSAHTTTVSVATSSFINAIIAEFSGVPATGALHADASATGTSTNPSGAGITPTVDGLHVFAVFHNNNGAFTAGAGWTELLNADVDGATRIGLYVRDAANGVTQTPAVTHATSAAWMILHAVLADDGGGGGAAAILALGNIRGPYRRPAPYSPGHAR